MAPKQCGKFSDISKSSEIANHPAGVVGICRRNKIQHLIGLTQGNVKKFDRHNIVE
jgi:hypothetical protein